MFFISLVFTFLIANAGYGLTAPPSAYSSDVTYDDGINYESLVEKIQTSGTQTLEQALDLVPQEFYINYVLMYRSRSLQDANPRYPRAIVFGRSAKFIMAFNGHERQKGYNNLEIVQFREKSFRWEFREITFESGKAPHFSEANPKKCLECHQSPSRTNVDPRPNWEPYNFWPGAYASVDDKIQPVLKADYEKYTSGQSSSLYGTLAKFLPQDLFLLDEQAQEQENLEKFETRIKPSHERYKHLGAFNTRSPLSLTKSTVILNMRRVLRIARDELGDLFNVYKYTLLGIGDAVAPSSSVMMRYACGDLYMPESVQQKHLQIALQTKDIPQSEYQAPPQSYGWQHGVAAGLDILLRPLGLVTDDLSMDFRTNGRFSADDRFTSPHSASSHLREAAFLVFEGDPAVQMDCDQLKVAAEKSLSEFESSGGLDRVLSRTQAAIHAPPTRQLVSRCISCHVDFEDGGIAPSIPFDDFNRLKPLLNVNKYPRGTLFNEILYRTSDHAPLREQMPPAGQVDRRMRDEFIASLEALLN
jgi:hypothetical protein